MALLNVFWLRWIQNKIFCSVFFFFFSKSATSESNGKGQAGCKELKVALEFTECRFSSCTAKCSLFMRLWPEHTVTALLHLQWFIGYRTPGSRMMRCHWCTGRHVIIPLQRFCPSLSSRWAAPGTKAHTRCNISLHGNRNLTIFIMKDQAFMSGSAETGFSNVLKKLKVVTWGSGYLYKLNVEMILNL